jgi:hypothetical protein
MFFLTWWSRGVVTKASPILFSLINKILLKSKLVTGVLLGELNKSNNRRSIFLKKYSIFFILKFNKTNSHKEFQL